ncbi:MAG: hypothetical protein ACR2PA_18795, partial [Hyphomicrobiaceae bacterium]
AGVTYFTLRQRWDPGAKYMPDARDRLTKGNQRTRIRPDIPVTSDTQRKSLDKPAYEAIFEPESDGMAAWMLRCGRDQSLKLPDARGTGGQYIVVAHGELMWDGRAFDKWSTLFVMPDEPPPPLTATQHGVDLLILQFPACPGPHQEA